MTRAATKLAINRLLERRPLDDAAVDRFIGRHGTPIIEGSRVAVAGALSRQSVTLRSLPNPAFSTHARNAVVMRYGLDERWNAGTHR